MSKRQSHYIQLDLMLILVFLIIVSVLAIYNAQQLGQYPGQNFAVKQLVYYALGIGMAVALQFVDIEQLYKSSLYLYILGVLSLIVLYFSPTSIAEPKNNAKSWFTGIPFITIQPSEFMKIAFILFLAYLIYKHKRKFTTPSIGSDLWLIAKIVISAMIPVFFIWKQPDMGTSIVFLFIAGVLIILSGIDWKILGVLIVSGLTAIILTLLFIINFPGLAKTVLPINQYQIDRVMTWKDPDAQVSNDLRYHIDLSLLTVGSGQLTGKGMKNPEVQIPEAHTDFIFSIIGESFGFIGGSIVIVVFFLLIYKLVTLGMKSFEFSPYASFVCYGFMALILIHTFQNIGMTIGITPITGIPLLFVSYGGSTTLSTMIGFGIIYRIAVEHSRHKEFLFN